MTNFFLLLRKSILEKAVYRRIMEGSKFSNLRRGYWYSGTTRLSVGAGLIWGGGGSIHISFATGSIPLDQVDLRLDVLRQVDIWVCVVSFFLVYSEKFLEFVTNTINRQQRLEKRELRQRGCPDRLGFRVFSRERWTQKGPFSVQP